MTEAKAKDIPIADDVRYSFTAQFLCSSAIFARRCKEIENIHTNSSPDEPTRIEHRGLVTAAIMQCAAAVEAESAEVLRHGPGAHLGSNGIDTKARDLLMSHAEDIDRKKPLQRYKGILRILDKRPLCAGEQPWLDMATLVDARNEITHYKSLWGKMEKKSKVEMKRKGLLTRLRKLDLSKPPFIPSGMNFFPHQFLSAECAVWSVVTAVAFLKIWSFSILSPASTPLLHAGLCDGYSAPDQYRPRPHVCPG